MEKLSKKSTYFCPIVNGEITERQCVQFHGGGALPNKKRANDFA